MSKRHYLSDIIGTGTADDPFRVAAGEFPGLRVAADIPAGPDGRPLHTQALCIVAAKDHTPIRAAKGVDALPDDSAAGQARTRAVAAARAALTRRGLPAAALDDKADHRTMVRAVGRALNPAFDDRALDVRDVQ